MHVVCKDRASQYLNTRSLASTSDCAPDIGRRGRVYTPDPLIGVPGDVRVHLKGVVAGHLWQGVPVVD